jgi:DNA polymerase-3 subunit delta'
MGALATKPKMHHAYLLATGSAPSEEVRVFVAAHFNVSVTGNADFFHLRADTLSVEEARQVSDRASRGSLGDAGIFFLIEAAFLTRESQNALLKTLEEPATHATFVIAVPSGEHLLATVRSRLSVIPFVPRTSVTGGREFLEAEIPARLKTIAALTEEKDRSGVLRILGGLEEILYREFRAGNTAVLSALREIARARTYIGDTGSSIKMLLESVAVALGTRR